MKYPNYFQSSESVWKTSEQALSGEAELASYSLFAATLLKEFSLEISVIFVPIKPVAPIFL